MVVVGKGLEVDIKIEMGIEMEIRRKKIENLLIKVSIYISMYLSTPIISILTLPSISLMQQKQRTPPL
jgi:hypothetical protein